MKRDHTRIVIEPSGDMIVLDHWKELLPLPAFSNSSNDFPVTHIGLHEGEEPFLSGEGPVITIYFAKCNLKCKDCTNDPNWETASYSQEDLLAAISRYIQLGGKSVSFVSPTLYYRKLLSLFSSLKAIPHSVPLIYNCGGLESLASIQAVSSSIDIFQPDFKAISREAIQERNLPAHYGEQLLKTLPSMLENHPIQFKGDQLVSGVVIRHLLIPNHPEELQLILEKLLPYSDQILFNVMTHYYLPNEHRMIKVPFPPISETLLKSFSIYVDGRKGIR